MRIHLWDRKLIEECEDPEEETFLRNQNKMEGERLQELPPDMEGYDVEGKFCPCMKCVNPYPRGADRSDFILWRQRVIHYAFAFKFSNACLREWLITPASLYDHLESPVVFSFTKAETRMSIMDQYNDQYNMFFALNRIPIKLLRIELCDCIRWVDGDIALLSRFLKCLSLHGLCVLIHVIALHAKSILVIRLIYQRGCQSI